MASWKDLLMHNIFSVIFKIWPLGRLLNIAMNYESSLNQIKPEIMSKNNCPILYGWRMHPTTHSTKISPDTNCHKYLMASYQHHNCLGIGRFCNAQVLHLWSWFKRVLLLLVVFTLSSCRCLITGPFKVISHIRYTMTLNCPTANLSHRV